MASRALTNILGGIMEGAAGALKDRRLKREETQQWEAEKQRKREMLDIQNEYSQREEDRRRRQRKTDEQAAYDLSKQRKNQEMLDMQEAIKNIDPERWNNDQAYKRSIMMQQLGVKVPALPTNPKIQQAMLSGDIEKGLALASSSSNPEDRQFFNDMLAMITKAKAFKQFEGNIGNVSQGALARVAGQPGSTAIPMPGKGKTGKAAVNAGAGSKESKAIINNFKDQVKTQKAIVEHLAGLKDDPDAQMQDPKIADRHAYEVNKLNKLNNDLMTALQGGTTGNNREAAMQAIKDLFNEFTPKKQ